MKVIYNAATARAVWRGEAYLVDGQSGTVDPPLYLLDEVAADPPTYDPATETIERQPYAADIEAGEWRDGWTKRDLTADELAARARKVWPSAQDFWLEFEADEMAGIATGTDAHLATLRTTLGMWRGEVWGDDERVTMGLGLLQQLGILTPGRAAAISAK
jgi:hypothetical protein